MQRSTGPAGFQSNRHNQRAALLLVDNTIYVAYGSFGDVYPYHGWILSFDATTLEPKARFNGTPGQGLGAGIWMSGDGLSADSDGAIYLSTGNGTFNPDSQQFAQSVLKLSKDLNLIDSFTPCNVQCLNNTDLDLSSAGIVVLSEQKRLLSVGKEGMLYVLDQDRLGSFDPHRNLVEQDFCVGDNCGSCAEEDYSCGNSIQCGNLSLPGDHGSGSVRGAPVYYRNSAGAYLYVWPVGKNCIKAYRQRDDGRFDPEPAMQGQCIKHESCDPYTPFPGGLLSLSAREPESDSAIIWALTAAENANQSIVPGILHALDANNLSEIWNSEQNPERDRLGNLSKFPPPVVANGKVYVATMGAPMNDRSGTRSALVVYGMIEQ